MGHFLGVRLEVFTGIFEVVLWYIAVFYGNIDKIIDNDAMLCLKSLTCTKRCPFIAYKISCLAKKNGQTRLSTYENEQLECLAVS